MTETPVTDARAMEPVVFAVQMVHNIFSAALRARMHGLQYLPYDALTPDNLPIILHAFHVTTPLDQLLLMQSQFNYDAKIDYCLRPFPTERKEKQPEMTAASCVGVTGKLRRLYEQLAASDGNICCSDAS